MSEQTEEMLRQKAAEFGETPEVYAAKVLEGVILSASLRELTAPLNEEFRRSRMTEDELSDWLEEIKHQMRRERRGAA